MASSFKAYSGGISAPTGISEAGANIGKMYQQGLEALGEGLAGGIQTYFENSAKWDMASAEADSLAQQIASTQQILLSNPAYAPFAQSLAPVIDELSTVKTKSLPQALGILNTAKTKYNQLGSSLQMYDAVRKDNELRLFGDAMNAPVAGKEVPVKTAPNELLWDYTASYNDNLKKAGAYWDQVNQAYGGKAKMIPKDKWLASWARNLETQIASDEETPIEVRNKAIENIRMMQYASGEEGWADAYYGDFSIPESDNPNIPKSRFVGHVGSTIRVRESNVEKPAVTTSGIRPIQLGEIVTDENGNVTYVPPSQKLATKARTDMFERYLDSESERYLGMAQEELLMREQNAPETTAVEEKKQYETSARPKNYEFDVGRTRLINRTKQIANEHNELRQQYLAENNSDRKERILSRMTEKMQELRRVNELLRGFEATSAASGKAEAPAPEAPAQVEQPAIPSPVESAPAAPVAPAAPATLPPPPAASAPAAPVPEAVANMPAPQQAAPAPAPAPALPPPPTQEAARPQVPKPEPDTPRLAPRNRTQAPQAIPEPPSQQAPAVSVPISPSAAPAQSKGEPKLFNVPVRKDGKEVGSSFYSADPNSKKYEVISGESLFSISRRTGVPMEAIMKANDLPMNIRSDDLLNFSNKNGGIIIPNKVKPEDVPESQKQGLYGNRKKVVSTRGGSGPFAMIMPSVMDEGVEEAPANVPAGREKRPIKTIGSAAVSPEADEQARIESGMSPADWAKVKTARTKVSAEQTSLFLKKRGHSAGIEWLTSMRNSVADGNSDMIDFGPYGQWEMLNPNASTAIQVGFDVATIFSGVGNVKKLQAAKATMDTAGRAKLAAEASKKAHATVAARRAAIEAEHAKTAIGMKGRVGEELARRTKLRLDAEDAKAIEEGLKAAGIQVDAQVKRAIGQLSKEQLKAGAKAGFWTGLFESMYGVSNAAPDAAINDEETESKMNAVLDGVRSLRTGYVPFGLGQGEGWFGVNEATGAWEKLTADEQLNIVNYLDEKIVELESDEAAYDKRYKSNSEVMSDARLLRAKFDDFSMVAPKPQDVDNGYTPSRPFRSGSMEIATAEVGPTPEQKKSAMREFMKQRLGYVPSGFESMYQEQFPESTLKFQETPYGVMMHDGKSWQQVKGGNSVMPDEIAKQKAPVFGQLQQDGSYVPTEFIKGSGVKIGGIGSFGTAEAAGKFRTDYTKLVKARNLARELMKINEQTFRSMSPELWGKAAAKVASLIAQMRITLIGVGSVSDFEQQILRDLVQDPTKFFSLQSTTRAKYESMIEQITEDIRMMPEAYGLTVVMDEEEEGRIQAARQMYLKKSSFDALPASQQAMIRKQASYTPSKE
jgi:hypothetical protein